MLITTLAVSFLGCCRLEVRCGWVGVVSGLQAIAMSGLQAIAMSGLQAIAIDIACSPDTTPAQPHLTSNLQQPKNETTNVVINIIVASS